MSVLACVSTTVSCQIGSVTSLAREQDWKCRGVYVGRGVGASTSPGLRQGTSRARDVFGGNAENVPRKI